jgi:hypothetical protein
MTTGTKPQTPRGAVYPRKGDTVLTPNEGIDATIERMERKTREAKAKGLTNEQVEMVSAMVMFTEQNWSSFLVIAEEYRISEDDADRILSELGSL